MTDEIDSRIAIDTLIAHVRKVAKRFGVTPRRDDIVLLYAVLEDMLPSCGGAPGELQRVESELMDYEPVAPYGVYVSDINGSLECSFLLADYRAAQDLARHHSGARSVAVFIRDAKDVVIWEIRLTDAPLNE